MKRIFFALLATLFVTGSLAAGAATPKQITIKMNALNHSGEHGTATLTQLNGGVKVVVKLVDTPAWAQPTHIHIGVCGHIHEAPEYPLTAVRNGVSSTIVPGITLAALLDGAYAINVHRSAKDLPHYVACGNIE